MRPKTLVVLLLVGLGLLIVLVAVGSWFLFPDWRAVPYGPFLVLIAALAGAASLASGVAGFVKNTTDILKDLGLFQPRQPPLPDDTTTYIESSSSPSQPPYHIQEPLVSDKVSTTASTAAPRQLIHTVDFAYENSPTNHGWRIGDEQRFVLSHLRDDQIGTALEIESLRWGEMDLYLSDVNPAAELGTCIEYVAQLGKGAVFYTGFRIEREDNAQSKNVWLNFQVGRGQPEQVSASEWAVYIQPDHYLGPWLVFQIDLDNEIERTYGNEWNLVNLKQFRLRGNLTLARISIFERTYRPPLLEDENPTMPTTTMPNHIFISYARKDQPYARALAHHLRQHGFDTWMDDRIDFGDDWWDTIVENIRASNALVVVMTPESQKSKWVRRELLLALQWEKTIFPLLLRGECFPLLVDRQYATVTDDRMPPDRFIDRLRQVVPLPKSPEPPPPQFAPQKPTTLPREHPNEPEMILIPAGHFLMGSHPAKGKAAEDDEQPQHTLHLPEYYIAKTPITNAQYAVFVKATDHRLPGHWERDAPPRGKYDHPVIDVSWHDAVAYCDWLSELTGKPYRLPSEAEWEKAARGTDGRIYPWGDEWDAQRCNTSERGKRHTTPVGAYPAGASPYGLLDMAGNVWEWTLSLYHDYLYDPEDGRENLDADDDLRRVLRGGAFDVDGRLARCAYRYMYPPPARRYWSYGFRVCVVPQRD